MIGFSLFFTDLCTFFLLSGLILSIYFSKYLLKTSKSSQSYFSSFRYLCLYFLLLVSIPRPILISLNNYELFDKIGDGFTSTIRLEFIDNSHIEEGALIEVDYKYIYDTKKKNKKIILYTIRIITLIVFVINFAFLFSQFGFSLFGISL